MDDTQAFGHDSWFLDQIEPVVTNWEEDNSEDNDVVLLKTCIENADTTLFTTDLGDKIND